MPFNNGHSKSGGRKPGTPNRRTRELLEILNEHGYSPVADLIKWAETAKEQYKALTHPLPMGASLEDQIKYARSSEIAMDWVKVGVACASQLMPYVYPKRKPSEDPNVLSQDDLNKLPTNELVEMAEKALLEFKKE